MNMTNISLLCLTSEQQKGVLNLTLGGSSHTDRVSIQ